jgi:hypothetical protein
MSYRITLNGVPIECDTAEELLSLTGKHARIPTAAPKRQAAKRRANRGSFIVVHPQASARASKQLRNLLEILDKLASSKSGASAHELSTLAGFANPQGLGIFTAIAAPFLNGSGLSLMGDAVIKKRGTDRVRRWFAGPKITQVSDKLREALK